MRLTHIYRPPFYNKKLPQDIRELHNHAYDEFDTTVSMLNQSLGLSLRWTDHDVARVIKVERGAVYLKM